MLFIHGGDGDGLRKQQGASFVGADDPSDQLKIHLINFIHFSCFKSLVSRRSGAVSVCRGQTVRDRTGQYGPDRDSLEAADGSSTGGETNIYIYFNYLFIFTVLF